MTSSVGEPSVNHMEVAIALARANRHRGGHPIGAVVVREKRIIARATTTLRWECDPTCHAEINAIRGACKTLGSRYLEACILYSTFEPCPMCTCAAIWARMQGIVFGALLSDETEHARQRISIAAAYIAARGEPKLDIHAGFLRGECLKLIEPR